MWEKRGLAILCNLKESGGRKLLLGLLISGLMPETKDKLTASCCLRVYPPNNFCCNWYEEELNWRTETIDSV